MVQRNESEKKYYLLLIYLIMILIVKIKDNIFLYIARYVILILRTATELDTIISCEIVSSMVFS